MTFLLLIRYLTLWPWPLAFYRGWWSFIVGHMFMSTTKFECFIYIRSSVMSCDGTDWLPTSMRLQRMRRTTWPMYMGQFVPHIWNSWYRIVYSLCNFYGSTIKLNWLIRHNMVRPCFKPDRSVCACAKSHRSWTERCGDFGQGTAISVLLYLWAKNVLRRSFLASWQTALPYGCHCGLSMS